MGDSSFTPALWWRFVRWWLFLLAPEAAHNLAVVFLRWRRGRVKPPCYEGTELWGQRYENRLGLAAGFDKGYVIPEALFALGFGFVEIGTVTPRPQAGNPKPRVFRLPEAHGLINRMGFNNPGANEVARRLAAVKHRAGPIWLNVGKNKDTPNADAAADYRQALATLYPYGDAFVVNISSPNTPGLRDLQSEETLRPLLLAIAAEGNDAAKRYGLPARPLLLKLAPDLADDALAPIATVAKDAGFSGLIATNTTLARPVPHPESGGFSGPALEPRATAVLQMLAQAASGLVLVGVGGVTTPEDVRKKRAAGATLVQLYTSLIYGGPGHVKRLLRALADEAV